jgi:hypothetical protein
MLERPKFRSRVERDLVKRDLRFLDRFAFFKTRYLPSAVVDRLCERGFLAKTDRGRPRMTLKGWFAVLGLLRERTEQKSLTPKRLAR